MPFLRSELRGLRGMVMSPTPSRGVLEWAVGKQKRERLSAVGLHPTVSKSQALISISNLFSYHRLSCAHVSGGVTAGSYPDSVWGEGLVTAWTGGQFITGSRRETVLPVSQVCVSLDCARSQIIWAEPANADARRRSREFNRQPPCCEAT